MDGLPLAARPLTAPIVYITSETMDLGVMFRPQILARSSFMKAVCSVPNATCASKSTCSKHVIKKRPLENAPLFDVGIDEGEFGGKFN